MKETPRPSIWSQLDTRRDEKFSLYARYVNAAEVRSVRRLGADLEFVKGQGSYLYDQNGGRYLDCDSGSGVFALGRNHARMRLAMHELLDLDLLSLASRDTPLLAGLLAEELARVAPAGLNKVVFTNSGAETAEAAMKFARRLTGRPRFLYLQGDFHGLTYGALSVTDTAAGTLHHLAHAERRERRIRSDAARLHRHPSRRFGYTAPFLHSMEKSFQ